MSRYIMPVRGACCLLIGGLLASVFCGCRGSVPAQDPQEEALSVLQRYETCSTDNLLRALGSLRGDVTDLSDAQLSGICRRLQREKWAATTYMRQAMDELGDRGSYQEIRKCLAATDIGSPIEHSCRYFALCAVFRRIPEKADDAFSVFLKNPSTLKSPHDVEMGLTLAVRHNVRCEPALVRPLLGMGYDAIAYRSTILLEALGYDGPAAARAYALARVVDVDTSRRLSEKLALDVAADTLRSADQLARELALVSLMCARGEESGDFGMSIARTPEELSMAVSRWRDWWGEKRKGYPEFKADLTIRE